MSGEEGGGIFVSYRRQETSGSAGRLADQLVSHFGAGRVFMDVDTIEPGADFTEAIVVAVESCAVLLAVIGPHWLTATDEQGRRRLDDPDDIVRLEIEAALARRVRVIPILVENGAMPRRQELPEPLGTLARRNAFTLRHESFRYDAERLIAAVDDVLNARAEPRAQAAPEDRQGIAPPLAEKAVWQLELQDKNDAGDQMTFRLWSGSESHLVSLDFPDLKSDVIRANGIRANKSWTNRNGPKALNLGSTAAHVRVRVGSGRIASVVFTIGDQRLTWEAWAGPD